MRSKNIYVRTPRKEHSDVFFLKNAIFLRSLISPHRHRYNGLVVVRIGVSMTYKPNILQNDRRYRCKCEILKD